MEKELAVVKALTGILLQGSIAVPVIFEAVNGIMALISVITGRARPSLAQVADELDAQIATTDTNRKTEIARLKAKLGVA